MAQKVLIGGTAYELSGGKALKDGSAYSIENGKTAIDGATYNISLSKKTIQLAIAGSILGSSTYGSYVQVGTTRYTTVGTYEVEVGETITVAAGAARNTNLSRTYILFNGTKHESSGAGIMATYSFAAESNVYVYYNQRNTGVNAYNYATVTTG